MSLVTPRGPFDGTSDAAATQRGGESHAPEIMKLAFTRPPFVRPATILCLLLILAPSAATAGAAAEERLAVGERLKIGIVGGMVPGEPLWLVRRIERGGTVDLPGGVTLAVAGLVRSDAERTIATRFDGGRVVISRLDQGEDHGGGGVHAGAPALDGELAGLALAEPIRGTFVLEALLDVLREQTELGFFVNYSAMELEGIDRKQEITLDLPAGTPLRQVLDVTLVQLAGPFAELAWQVDGPLVHVTTRDDLSRHKETMTYDLTHLMWLTAEIEARQRPANEYAIGYEEAVEEVIQLIMDTVETDTWQDNGGRVGAITEMNGSLVITQTRPAQREIVRLLETLERDAEATLASLSELAGQ